MAKTLTFYGASDDIFIAGDDEFYSPYVARVSHDDEGAMIVRAFYGEGEHNQGVWCIGVEPIDEDVALPSWPATFSLSERGYSAVLALTVPDETTVEQVASDSD